MDGHTECPSRHSVHVHGCVEWSVCTTVDIHGRVEWSVCMTVDAHGHVESLLGACRGLPRSCKRAICPRRGRARARRIGLWRRRGRARARRRTLEPCRGPSSRPGSNIWGFGLPKHTEVAPSTNDVIQPAHVASCRKVSAGSARAHHAFPRGMAGDVSQRS